MSSLFTPETLDDLFGLDYLKESLRNYLSSEQVGHPLLFEGEKGCGKTTLAYIIAKEFGAVPDAIRHVNCGYYTKIDDMRKEIDNFNSPSLFDKQVFILDEIHRLTKNAQDAWLIPLDEKNLDPNRLVIICTTNTEEVKDVLLRRFLRYKVSPISQKEALNYINFVCKENEIHLHPSTKKKIIDTSDCIVGIINTMIPLVIGIEDEDKIDKLLTTTVLYGSIDLKRLFESILELKSWNTIKGQLRQILKSEKPDSVRVGLLQLSSDMLMKVNQIRDNEYDIISKLYTYLKFPLQYPHYSQLILTINSLILDLKKGV